MYICPECHHKMETLTTKCMGCDWTLSYKDNIPIYLSTKDRNDAFFNDYLENYKEISMDDIEKSIQDEKYLTSQNKKLFSYLPKLSGLSVCEIGIGKGILLEQILTEKPAKLVGIDISLPYLKQINSKYDNKVILEVANAENIPYINEFDVIIAADIIEHVINVGDFLTSVNRALKPNGTFVVKTPYNEDINHYSKLRGCPYNFVHLRNFSKQTLNTILTGAGFEVKKNIFDGFEPTRVRGYIKKFSLTQKLFNKYLTLNYETFYDVNTISNFLGNLLMSPIEITAISVKNTDILTGK